MSSDASKSRSTLKRVVDDPLWQFLIGTTAVASLLLPLILSDEISDWLGSFYQDNEWIILLILLVALVVAIVVIIRLSQSRSVPREGELDKAAKAIRKHVPGGDALVEYLRSTLFMNGRLNTLRGIDADHYLASYEKNFRLDGHDVWTYERFTIHNSSTHPTTRLLLPTFGGAALRAEELKAEVHQLQDGTRHLLRLSSTEDGERFKMLEAHFVTALAPGRTTQIEYNECWPRSMTYGIDAVIYTQTLYYARGIGELTSRIECDVPLAMINAWWYDFSDATCQPDDSGPMPVDTASPTKPVYTWRVPNPVASKLYFVVFDRPSP